MAITASEKIFIDVDDEINFVVEKILSSEKQRVILVAPQNALIISSQVSIKILARQIAKSDKLLVLVTEDAFGIKLAKDAGLTTSSKVSGITPEVWEEVVVLKERQKAELDTRKKELLARRGIGEGEVVSVVDAAVKEPVIEEPINSDGGKGEDGDEQEDKTEGEEDEEVKGAIQRTRPEAKMVEVGGIQIFAGGDVAVIKSESRVDEDTMAKEETKQRLIPENNKPKGGFTGRDWTKYTATSKGASIISRLPFFGRKDKAERGPEGEAKRKKKLRVMIAVGVVAVLFLLSGFYVMAFQISTVDVRIKQITKEVPVSQKINVDVALQQVDLEGLILPGLEIFEEELSVSGTAAATGTGSRGTKAAGIIEIWNKTEQEVRLLNGTKITEISSNNKYIIKQDVTLPAASRDANDPNVIDFGGIGSEIRVEAETFGAQYNLTGSTQGQEFRVDGYTTQQLIGKRFRDIEGGTSEDFVSVSEDNVNKLKETLTKELVQQGKSRLSPPAGYILIPNTEKLVDEEVNSTPNVGEEATEVNVSVSGTLTAIAVKEEDLQNAIQELIAKSEGVEGDFEVTGLDDAVMSEVTRTDGKVSFVVVSQGSLRGKITEATLKADLAGLTMEQAREYLDNLTDVESVTINFAPGIVPESLRRVPADASRIRVILQ